MFVRRNRTLPGVLFAFAVASSLIFPALAADDPSAPPPLPFTPPSAWTSIPLTFMKTLTTWGDRDAQSAFTVSAIPVALSPAMLQTVASAQGAKLGTPVSTNSDPICGGPAVRLVVKAYGAGQLMTEQIQTRYAQTYVTGYVRPAAAPPDPAIMKIMDTFCGPESIATAMPPDWHSTDGKMVGVWADSISSSPAAAPKHIITFYSQKADIDPQRVARAAAAIALPGSEVSIVSKSAGMLCGKPATFITARTNTPASPVEQEVRMEITQSDTMMYVLFYARPSSEAPSDVALASLTTLCAQ